MLLYYGLLSLILYYHGSLGSWPNFYTSDKVETWTGRWFPDRTTTPTPVEQFYHEGGESSGNMGVQDLCDDGKSHLDRDLPNNINYICMNPRNRIHPNPVLPPLLEFENIPKAYKAAHRCMNETLSYSSPVPTFGTHRQLWPVYGEYKFLPSQRWLHTLEHGGIVVLYHPCADLRDIAVLKNAVKQCIWRHVITPWADLDEDRPFAVVAWGVRLRLAHVNANAVHEFVQSHGLQGPEKISKDGQFNDMLLEKAIVVSDQDDSQLCPRPLAHD